MWDDLPYYNCNLYIDWSENQITFDSNNSNGGGKWIMFKNRRIHSIILNVNSLLPRLEEIRHLAQLINVSVIGISETKLDVFVLNSEIVTEGFDFRQLDCSKKWGGDTGFIKPSVAHSHKPNMCLNTENIFTEMYLPKSKPFTVSILCKSTLLIAWIKYLVNSIQSNPKNVISSGT